ncbi:MAG: hypothetical protein WC337_03095 [Candidatus Muiribacteriota bacterium]
MAISAGRIPLFGDRKKPKDFINLTSDGLSANYQKFFFKDIFIFYL